jgi:hypothetical protein
MLLWKINTIPVVHETAYFGDAQEALAEFMPRRRHFAR